MKNNKLIYLALLALTCGSASAGWLPDFGQAWNSVRNYFAVMSVRGAADAQLKDYFAKPGREVVNSFIYVSTPESKEMFEDFAQKNLAGRSPEQLRAIKQLYIDKFAHLKEIIAEHPADILFNSQAWQHAKELAKKVNEDDLLKAARQSLESYSESRMAALVIVMFAQSKEFNDDTMAENYLQELSKDDQSNARLAELIFDVELFLANKTLLTRDQKIAWLFRA